MKFLHSKNRLEALSDGVFAFAATLMVVNIGVTTNIVSFKEELPNLLSFAVSFFVMMAIWKTHYNFFRRTNHIDNWIITLNMILLFTVLFYIFPVKSLINTATGGKRITGEELSSIFQMYSIGFSLIFLSIHLMYFRAFKKEGVLEVWVKGWDGRFKKFDDYTSCASSGDLGPKRRQGDEQVPEGFYHISRFNPQSNYYLSLGINYPNQADRINNPNVNRGGSIYIHGSCKTIGCIPLTNEGIKEVYLLAVKAKNSGQGKIPVHIFPFKFNNILYAQKELDKRSYNYPLLQFWENLRQGYDHFENYKTIPKVSINSNGKYAFY